MHDYSTKELRPVWQIAKVTFRKWVIGSGLTAKRSKRSKIMFLTEKVQHGGKSALTFALLLTNYRYFRVSRVSNRPAPQTQIPIFAMLVQKAVKTVILAVLCQKVAKNSHFRKHGLLRSLNLSLLHQDPNMAISMFIWPFVFNPKEAWWTAQGDRRACYDHAVQPAGWCHGVVVPGYGVWGTGYGGCMGTGHGGIGV